MRPLPLLSLALVFALSACATTAVPRLATVAPPGEQRFDAVWHGPGFGLGSATLVSPEGEERDVWANSASLIQTDMRSAFFSLAAWDVYGATGVAPRWEAGAALSPWRVGGTLRTQLSDLYRAPVNLALGLELGYRILPGYTGPVGKIQLDASRPVPWGHLFSNLAFSYEARARVLDLGLTTTLNPEHPRRADRSEYRFRRDEIGAGLVVGAMWQPTQIERVTLTAVERGPTSYQFSVALAADLLLASTRSAPLCRRCFDYEVRDPRTYGAMTLLLGVHLRPRSYLWR
mgnify:CR=1 FL=1